MSDLPERDAARPDDGPGEPAASPGEGATGPAGAGGAGRRAHGPLVRGGATGTVRFTLDDGLAGRFAKLAAGRVLVVDYLVTRPAPAVPTAELSARLRPGAPAGAIVIGTVEGVPVVADPVLELVLREARPHLRAIAGGVLGQFEIDLARPLAWLDFLSSVAARRP